MARQPSSRRPRSRRRRLRSYAVRTLRVAILAAVLVGAVSLTVGTGIAPVDGAVDDISTGLGEFADDLVASPDGAQASEDQPVSATTERARLELAIHERVNEVRQERGLSTLAFDTELRSVARYHSEDMAEREYFSHTSPEGDTLQDRYERFGYDCRVPAGEFEYKTGGENLFTYRSSMEPSIEALANRTVAGWLDSPGHRRNLLDEDWRQEGIGVARADDGTIYVTQNFC